ncbi:MAG: glycosyltransferase [Planctomycetes bacterium]|nr:glycosyltransferase [Planctomycetota bacterium]
MRLLLVTHIFLPDARAGVETYVHELARALHPEIEVAVATTRKIISLPTGHWRENSLDGLRLFEAINDLDHEDFAGCHLNEAMERAFEGILDRFRPDVVHVNHLMYWSLRLPALARARGIRVVMTLHDFWLLCPRLGQLVDWRGGLCHLPAPERCGPCLEHFTWAQPPAARRWIRRLVRIRSLTGLALDRPMRALQELRKGRAARPPVPEERPAALSPEGQESWRERLGERDRAVRAMVAELDFLISPSPSLLGRMAEGGLAPGRSLALPQGRRHEPFAGLAARRRPDGRLRAAFIGTIAPHKGVLELVRATAGLDPRRFRLDLYGPFRQHADYEAVCRAAAGATQVFHGPVAPAAVPRLYEEIDLLCVPSLWDECCPLTIQEAFMAGVPVLASDLGGMRDLLAAGGGALLPPGEPAAWRAEIEALLAEPGRLERYRETLPAVPDMAEHAGRLLEIYRGGR